MTMILEVDSVEYNNFTEASCIVSMVDFGGFFTFTAATKSAQPLPFKGGEACRVIIEGEPVLSGTVEMVNVNNDARSHVISVGGRDIIADVSDSTLGAISDFTTPITLADAIQKVIGTIPGSEIKVIDDVGDLEPFAKDQDIISPGVGDNVFDYIQTLARKRQVLLNTIGDGNIHIARASTNRFAAGIQNVIGGDSNNVISSSVSYDFSQIFRTYQVRSQKNVSALNFGSVGEIKDIVDQSGLFEDKLSRTGRQMVIVAGQSMVDDDARESAKWEADLRRSRSVVYNATIQGFKLGNELITPNRLVPVVDQPCDIDSDMMIETVEYNLDLETGSTTTMNIVTRDSFTLELNVPTFGEAAGDSLTSKFN